MTFVSSQDPVLTAADVKSFHAERTSHLLSSVAQAFGGGGDHWTRPPSGKEYRLMAFSAAAAGATGTVVFGWEIFTPDVIMHSGAERNDVAVGETVILLHPPLPLVGPT